MKASHQLDQYLGAFKQRLKRLTIIQGLAIAAVAILLLSLLGAWLSITTGFSAAVVNGFRLLLLLALVAITLRFIAWPLRHLPRRLGRLVESRAPDFDGRIQTYLGMRERDNPLRDLLAEDTLRVSRAHPVEREVEPREFSLAAGAAIAAGLILLYLLVLGPGLLNFSLRNLFAGWAFDMLPPQAILISPGDQSVRRGSNLQVNAEVQGFDPDSASIHVRLGSNDWQEVPMQPAGEDFEFTFFSLQEEVDYYVSAGGLRSPSYEITVVDLPAIENLSLTLHYPEWTRRDPDTIEHGDLTALPDTQVALTVTTTGPLPEGGHLVLNEEGRELAVDGNRASADFTVVDEGQYYIAALVNGQPVRLSDDYFIRLAEDGSPKIEFVRPGRDWNASNIEEVLASLQASDDYGLEAVTLKYSVNGGDFESVEFDIGNSREVTAEHLFMLENMRNEAPPEPSSGQGRRLGQFDVITGNEEGRAGSTPPMEPEAPEPELVPLQPGDLITYYAEARDREQSAQTDMFFIQVQPFNRRFSQSQISGGGMGGGGPREDEISQRQRQIVVSTWNLIRERNADGDANELELNASLLADLQNTLAEQAQTLVQRTRARQLSDDQQIEEFVRNMERAVQSMRPASEHLAGIELDQAIQPAQEALQYLLRAESVFRDITVSQQQGGGGGAGGNASRDLAEMFELEMDMEKNQYESGDRASPQSQQQQAEDLMKELDELARRQQQLANNLRNQQQLSEAQRYQQDMLRRQAEELRERLEQLQRGQQGQQQQQLAGNQQQGQQGQAGGQQQGQSGQQIAQNEQSEQNELQRRLESAIRAMNESAEAMRGNDRESLQRAAEEARRQLEGAREQVAQDQQSSLRESFERMASQAEQMLREQERMERRLQEATRRAVAERQSGDNPNSRGMDLEEEWELARQKQELAAELQQLQQQMLSGMQRFSGQAPDATRELERANQVLNERELEQAIAEAALYIDSGYGLYIAGNEGAVTAGMREVAERLAEAERRAAGAGQGQDSELQRANRIASELRESLRQQLAAGQPGQAQQGQQQGEQGGQQPGQQQGQPGQQPGQSGQPGGGAGARGDWWAGGPALDGPVELPENFYDNLSELTEAARQALPDMNLGTEDMARLYDLVRELEYNQVNRNDAILTEEYNNMLALVEQLEAGLVSSERRRDANSVRTAIQDAVPEEYEDAVADYYRRLSRD